MTSLDPNKKYIVLSGIKPTGQLTLGNYLGAIKQFVQLQKQLPNAYFYIFIADLHATTIAIDPQTLKSNIRSIAAWYIASGLDLKRTAIFLQSEVLEHATLGYMMESTSYIGEMERMIQFKEKSQTVKGSGVRTSLLTYPALMAADILLYNADLVPIGEDQKQHLELTETLAKRFNHLYGETFKIPQGITDINVKRIKSLQDPNRKMSKSSDNTKSYILLEDDLNIVRKKIMSAVTDSDPSIKYDPALKPGLSNLIDIYSGISGMSSKDVAQNFKDISYKDFKTKLADVLVNELASLQTAYNEILHSPKLDEILTNGQVEASKRASTQLTLAKKHMGLTR